MPDVSFPGTPAEAYLRARGITGRLDWPALRYPPVGLLPRIRKCSAGKSGRRLLAAVTDRETTSPAFSAPGSIQVIDKAPLADPRRAIGHLLGNGVRFGCAADMSRRRRRRRDHARAQIGPAAPADDRRAFGQSSRRARSAPGYAVSMSPATTTRPVQGGGKAARTRNRSRHRNPRARAGHRRLQRRSCATRPRWHARRTSRTARPLRPDRFLPYQLRSRRSFQPISVRSAARRKEERFSCRGSCLRTQTAARWPSRAGDLPEARAAG